MPVVQGTQGNDELNGTDDNDTINGLGGDDAIVGAGGSDSLNGGSGNDTITAGPKNDTLVGGEGDDLLSGGNGFDLFEPGPGDDTINGGLQALSPGESGTGRGDTISFLGAPSGVVVDIPAGRAEDGYGFTDSFSGIESATGTVHDDTLIGDSENNALRGGGGDDVLLGGGGPDFLSGDAGNDRIELGDVDDPLSPFFPVAFGSGGNDTIIGGNGFDRIHGGRDNDLIDGGAGNDYLHGEEGNDTILGGQGDDFIDGGSGNDSLNGGSGNDLLLSGGDRDTLTGGEGIDSFDLSNGRVTITDFEPNAGEAINLSGATPLSLDDLQTALSSSVADGNDTLIEFQNGIELRLENVSPDDLSIDNFAIGTRDRLFGSPVATEDPDILALFSVGTSIVSSPNRWVPGQTLGFEIAPELSTEQAHFVRATYSAIERVANLSFREETGGVFRFSIDPSIAPFLGTADLVNSPISNIRLLNSDIGLSTIIHEIGHSLGLRHPNESLVLFNDEQHGIPFTLLRSIIETEARGFEAYDGLAVTGLLVLDIEALVFLYGDSGQTFGDDTYIFDTSQHYLEGLHDGGGVDTISIVDAAREGVSLDLTPRAGLNVGSGNATTNLETVFTTRFTIIENVSAAGGDDHLIGNDVNNRLVGGAGDDTLDGGAGDDDLRGDDGDDHLAGGDGNDLLRGFEGNDVVSGAAGNDTIWAGSGDTGDDLVAGGTGRDLIAGGAGSDFLVGGGATADILSTAESDVSAGSDTIFGGDGDDTLLGAGWNDNNDNGAYNTGEAVTSDSQANALYGGAGNDLVIGAAGADQLGGGTESDDISGHAGADILWGGQGDGNDTLDGGSGSDTLFGGLGNDILRGGNGGDQLFGGAGSDVINGGAVGDSLFGGAGDDTLAGGTGADSFFFANNHGDDVVSDFSAGEDTLFLANTVTDFTDRASVQAASSETTVGGQSGLLIDTGGGNSVFLIGVSQSELTEQNFVL